MRTLSRQTRAGDRPAPGSPPGSRWPRAVRGQVIGLLGGSFDPPHAGHVHLTREALKRLRLDRVWWLVSPGNPLKPNPPAPLADRIVAARALMRHPRVQITGIEADLGTRATVDTLAALRRHYPGVRFVWLMGADNLAGFHRWDRWQRIIATVPVVALARPGQRRAALTARLPRQFRTKRLKGGAVRMAGQVQAPAWAYLDMPMRAESSTELRRGSRFRHWKPDPTLT